MLYQNVEKMNGCCYLIICLLLFDYMYVVICTPFYNCVTTGPLQQQQKQQQRQRLVKIYLKKKWNELDIRSIIFQHKI